jgi:hypothetical protein
MANSYYQFAQVLDALTPTEEAWLRESLVSFADDIDADVDHFAMERLARPWLDEDGGHIPFEYKFGREDDKTTLLFYSEESGDLESVTRLVRAFLRTFRPMDTWSATWSVTCDKSRPDHFYGGAVVVSAIQEEWWAPDAWIKKIKEAFSHKLQARQPRSASVGSSPVAPHSRREPGDPPMPTPKTTKAPAKKTPAKKAVKRAAAKPASKKPGGAKAPARKRAAKAMPAIETPTT